MDGDGFMGMECIWTVNCTANGSSSIKSMKMMNSGEIPYSFRDPRFSRLTLSSRRDSIDSLIRFTWFGVSRVIGNDDPQSCQKVADLELSDRLILHFKKTCNLYSRASKSANLVNLITVTCMKFFTMNLIITQN